MLTRRNALLGLLAGVVAPAIVPRSSLMAMPRAPVQVLRFDIGRDFRNLMMEIFEDVIVPYNPDLDFSTLVHRGHVTTVPCSAQSTAGDKGLFFKSSCLHEKISASRFRILDSEGRELLAYNVDRVRHALPGDQFALSMSSDEYKLQHGY